MKVINFMGRRKLAALFSILLVAASIASLMINQLNWGLDFTGGTLVEVGYQQPAELNKVRAALAEEGFQDATAQHFGTPRDVLVRLAPRSGSPPGEHQAHPQLSPMPGTGRSLEDRERRRQLHLDTRPIAYAGTNIAQT